MPGGAKRARQGTGIAAASSQELALQRGCCERQQPDLHGERKTQSAGVGALDLEWMERAWEKDCSPNETVSKGSLVYIYISSVLKLDFCMLE